MSYIAFCTVSDYFSPYHQRRLFARWLRLYRQQAGEGLVAGEEEGDAGGVGGGVFIGVGGVDGAVQRLVGAEQIGRHGERIVEIGQARARMRGAGIEHGLGCGFDGDALLVGGFGPGEVVVNDAGGITVIAFQPPTDSAHPGVVHAGCEDAKVERCGETRHQR